MYRTTQIQNLHFTFFDQVTSDDLDLTRAYQSLSKVLRGIPDTINAVSSDLLQPDITTLPDDASDDSLEKADLWPDL